MPACTLMRRGAATFSSALDGHSRAPGRREDIFYHLLGHHVGRVAGQRIPVIAGLPPQQTQDDLKALSAAVAASGGVELWHARRRHARGADQASRPSAAHAQAECHDVTL